MDQKRLFLAIAISVASLLGFQLLIAPHLPKPPVTPPQQTASNGVTPPQSGVAPPQGSPGTAAQTAAPTVPKNVPRVKIAAPRLGADMTARTPESFSTCLADWSILVIGNPMPPRDPNDDDDDDDENED